MIEVLYALECRPSPTIFAIFLCLSSYFLHCNSRSISISYTSSRLDRHWVANVWSCTLVRGIHNRLVALVTRFKTPFVHKACGSAVSWHTQLWHEFHLAISQEPLWKCPTSTQPNEPDLKEPFIEYIPYASIGVQLSPTSSRICAASKANFLTENRC